MLMDEAVDCMKMMSQRKFERQSDLAGKQNSTKNVNKAKHAKHVLTRKHGGGDIIQDSWVRKTIKLFYCFSYC